MPLRAEEAQMLLCTFYEHLCAQVCSRFCGQLLWSWRRAASAGGAPGVRSWPPTAVTPQAIGANGNTESRDIQRFEGLRERKGGGLQEMERRWGRVFLLPMCFEFRAGWAQDRLFALEGPLVNSFLPGFMAGGLERGSWSWAWWSAWGGHQTLG